MDIKEGYIVDCGNYGHEIYVCWVEGDKFWGTDSFDEYEKGNDARGWYFNVSSVREIVGEA